LNYNVKSSAFKYSKEFYNSLASAVVKFCKKNRIACHIKKEHKYKEVTAPASPAQRAGD